MRPHTDFQQVGEAPGQDDAESLDCVRHAEHRNNGVDERRQSPFLHDSTRALSSSQAPQSTHPSKRRSSQTKAAVNAALSRSSHEFSQDRRVEAPPGARFPARRSPPSFQHEPSAPNVSSPSLKSDDVNASPSRTERSNDLQTDETASATASASSFKSASITSPVCSNCQTTQTPLWRRDGKGGLMCGYDM